MGTADGGWRELRLRVDGRTIFVRQGPDDDERPPVVHVHGFAVSGTSLMPTARRLGRFGTQYVVDLPGHGRSEGRGHALGIPALAEAVLEVVGTLGLDRVVLLGNSMGCPVSLEAARRAPDLVDRVVLVSPAGGIHNQPFPRAVVQLARDGRRESPRMLPLVVPDYLRFGPFNAVHMFSELTRFPSLGRLLRIAVPALAVIGSRDPLMPPPARIRELAHLAPEHVSVVLIEGAAHAANFSHPGELAHVVRSWLDGREITDDPNEPGLTRVLRLGRR